MQKCGEAEHFVIVQEQALASGIRRILALTGSDAQTACQNGIAILQRVEALKELEGSALADEHDALSQLVDEKDISQPIRQVAKGLLKELHTRVKAFQKEAASSVRDGVLEQARQLADLEENVVVASIDNGDNDSMLSALDAVRSKRPDGAVMLFTANAEDGKVIIVAGVGKSLISKGLKAGDWVKEAAMACGGGGGGRPDTAQAGGKEPEKIPDAMNAAREYVKEAIQ